MMTSGYTYTARQGDTFDSIALDLYEDERYASELLWVNPALCEVLVFEGGEVLSLHVVQAAAAEDDEDEDEADTPFYVPWKEL